MITTRPGRSTGFSAISGCAAITILILGFFSTNRHPSASVTTRLLVLRSDWVSIVAQANAVASSTLSALIAINWVLVACELFFMVLISLSRVSSRSTNNASRDMDGLDCRDHLIQCDSGLSAPGPVNPSFSANQRATAGLCSSHCSRSSAS